MARKDKGKEKAAEKDREDLAIDKDFIEKRKNEILGILIIAFALLSVISLFTDTAGLVGRELSRLYFYVFGYGSYIIPILLLIWGITLIRLKGFQFNFRLLGFLLAFITFLAILHTYQFPDYPLENALEGQGAGLIGGTISWIAMKLFGYIGAFVMLTAFLLIGVLLWANIFLISLFEKIKTYFKKIVTIIREKRKKEKSLDENLPVIDISDYEEINTYEEDFEEKQELIERDMFVENKDKNEVIDYTPVVSDEPATKDKNEKDSNEYKYRLPGLKFLNDTRKDREKPGNKSSILEETLQSFGVNAKVIKVNHGPTITRYELQPASGVKVSRIVSLADDIALALAAPGVRIEAPIPGKAAVGIEVPHMKNITIGLKDIIASREFTKTRARIPLALGMGIDGKPIVADLAEMPHLLVAGATGSGKSVCINTIITSILYKATPDEVKMILIDPKKVELSVYQGLPHLFAPVVTDPKKAAAVLKLVVKEMEERYDLFSETGTRGIESYNRKVAEEERLPYIVVIVDELSDLMMVSANEVEESICRLAQMARAAGIHLILATQRPSVDVITGLIKANIPSRISFAVSSQTDSRTILDMGGAEKLLGKGDMLFYPTGIPKPQRVQGAYIDNDEISAIVDFVKNQANPDYIFDIEDINDPKLDLDKDDERDELYYEAIKLVVNHRASISMLQRKLRIGHSRAARMIDMMEEDGIVGPYAGSKAREVLITREELEDFLKERQVDTDAAEIQ
ncbi:MAG: DNA translocase FtsK [Halanaerobiaceae bacterium]|nr:DNA translocase FtsK [Halanaerobiaceae bacterium]